LSVPADGHLVFRDDVFPAVDYFPASRVSDSALLLLPHFSVSFCVLLTFGVRFLTFASASEEVHQSHSSHFLSNNYGSCDRLCYPFQEQLLHCICGLSSF
jgi:hypothetical protein